MINAVFTGPAYDGTGHAIIRDNLIAACLTTGAITVAPRISCSTDVLVASRKDTVKAKAAAARGIPVLTYPEFIQSYLKLTKVPTGAKPNAYTDCIDTDIPVPDFTWVFNENDVL
jgi:hypothetical protein